MLVGLFFFLGFRDLFVFYYSVILDSLFWSLLAFVLRGDEGLSKDRDATVNTVSSENFAFLAFFNLRVRFFSSFFLVD